MSDLHLYKRGAFLSFFLFLGLVLLLKWVAFNLWDRETDDRESSDELAQFAYRIDSLEESAPYKPASAGESFYKTESRNTAAHGALRVEPKIELHPFNPNTADSLELVSLGLRPFVVKNILKYRSCGGIIRTPSDLGKIYGMDDETYERLKPYILLTEKEKAVAGANCGKQAKTEAKDEPNLETAASGIEMDKQEATVSIVELNTVDSATLVSIKGVGAYTARKILAYRNALGGFVSVSQLDEIEGIRSENLERLKELAHADSMAIRPIELDNAPLKQLQMHPYISFRQAKAIIELRKHRNGHITSDDLQYLEEFTPTDLERLAPYLAETPPVLNFNYPEE